MKKPKTCTNHGTLTAKPLDIERDDLVRQSLELVAPALERVGVTAGMNAAQHYILEGVAKRHRCSVGELMLTLAMLWLEAGGASEAVKCEEILNGLGRFVDAGRRPFSQCVHPEEDILVEKCPARVRAKALLSEFGPTAHYIRASRGEAVDFVKVDAEIKRLNKGLSAPRQNAASAA